MTTTDVSSHQTPHPSRNLEGEPDRVPATVESLYALVQMFMVDGWERWAQRRLPSWPPETATVEELILFWADPEMDLP